MLQLDTDIELLRLTTAGSVDDGKSSLIGRLLYDCQAIFDDQYDSVAKVSKKKGKEDVDLALLLDGLAAEREQGITIDVAYRYFSTPKRKFIIADCPGHEQYTRNMVTGASTANAALILCDARKGLLTQSKRHLFVSALLGIPHILVVVNKMDLVDYSQEVFEQIKSDFIDFAAKLDVKHLSFVPVSAVEGDMVVHRGENMDWYNGSTVLSFLEELHVISDRNLIDFRFPVQYVIRPNQDFRGYAGMIEGGSIRRGEKIRVLPSGKKSVIKSIICDEEEVEMAFNPQSVVLSLENEIDISRGDMIVRENNVPKVGQDVQATICWFADEPLSVNKRYLFKHTTQVVSGYVSELQYKLDIDSLHRQDSESLELNDIGRVKISLSKPIMFDVYAKNRNTGSFIIVDELTNNTVGAGVIISKGKKTEAIRVGEEMSVKKGAVMWFTGLSGSGKSTIANALYDLLKEKGIKCERLDGDIMRENLSSDLGFSKEDRDRNIDRAGFVANLLSNQGVIVLASFISPYEEKRAKLKDDVHNFVEVFVNAPLEVCENRDVKGLYKKARAGEINDFTGISAPYEEPKNPDIELKTGEEQLDDVVEKLFNYLLDNQYIA